MPAGQGKSAVFADRPNALRVSDFTYVATWQGFVYVAFVIDVFARRIVGWKVSSSARTAVVLQTHHQRRSDPRQYGYNVGCLEGVNPFAIPDVPVNDGIHHPADKPIGA